MMSSMRGVVVLALVSGLFGCAAADDGDSDEMMWALRSGVFPSPPNYPGNGDLSIYAGHTTASEDCLIYDILGPDVHDGAASDGAPVLVTIVGDAIQTPEGATLCTVEGDALVDRVRTGGPEGPVLFTSFGRWVFEGEVDVSGGSLHEIVAALGEQLVFSFYGPHIYDGSILSGEVVATATKPLTHASTNRKLLVAAMLAGECGGLGIPEEP